MQGRGFSASFHIHLRIIISLQRICGETGMIENAGVSDISLMVHLSEAKRMAYEEYQPVFWRKADGSEQAQRAFFEDQLGSSNVIALVYRENKDIEGFIIGALKKAPPVYAPGGLTCVIDDFCVRENTC